MQPLQARAFPAAAGPGAGTQPELSERSVPRARGLGKCLKAHRCLGFPVIT